MLNGELERGWGGDCVWWDEWGEHTTCPQEVDAPSNWTAWWFNQVDLCNEPHKTGQPEMKIVTDPDRVWSGRQGLQWFTLFRCHYAGVLQMFRAEPGVYRAQAKYHSYYSSCDSRPYATWPMDQNCMTISDPYWQMYARIGIDSHCGTNPFAPGVVWSPPFHCHGEWCTIATHPVLVQSCATVFIETRATAPLKHNDAFIDNIILEKLQ